MGRKNGTRSAVSTKMAFKMSTDRVFSLALLLMGVSTSQNVHFENTHALLLISVGSITGFCLARNFSNLESRVYLLDNMVFFIAVLFVMNILFISYGNKKRLARIFTASLRDRKILQFSRLNDRHLKSYLTWVGCLCFGSLLFMNSLPILVAILEEDSRGSTMTLLFPCWFPWNIDSTERYLLTVGLQLAVGGLLYSVVFGEMVFLVCCMALVRAHNDFFRVLATTWCAQVAQRSDWEEVSHVDQVEESMRRRYRDLISHYQRMHRNINDIAHCCGFYSSNSLFIFLGGVIFFTVILLEDDDQSHIIYKTKVLSSQLLSYQFVVFTYFGETITELNDNFRRTIYDTKWYERRPKLKNMIVIFMQLTNVPLKMSAFRMFPIKLGILTCILRTCFSLIQLLSRV